MQRLSGKVVLIDFEEQLLNEQQEKYKFDMLTACQVIWEAITSQMGWLSSASFFFPKFFKFTPTGLTSTNLTGKPSPSHWE